MEDRKFVGSAKEVGQYGGMSLSICLSDLSPEDIKDHNGKKWLNLFMGKKRNIPVGKPSHYIYVNNWEPEESPAKPELKNDLPF